MTTDLSAAATPWVERYRPKSLNDVSHQTEVVATLQNAVKTGRLPHLLFYGPPGSGKVRDGFSVVLHFAITSTDAYPFFL
jgi:replication-associated recombination protein RarA